MFVWVEGIDMIYIVFIVILLIIVLYVLFEYYKKCWLVVLLSCLFGGLIVFLLGVLFEFKIVLDLLNMNLMYWWGENIGWMLGLLILESFVVVLLFVVFVVVMWLFDFLGY